MISCVNYTAKRLFNFNLEPIKAAAEAFLVGGVTETEIPQGVLEPDETELQSSGQCFDGGSRPKIIQMSRMFQNPMKRLPVQAEPSAYLTLGEPLHQYRPSNVRPLFHVRIHSCLTSFVANGPFHSKLQKPFSKGCFRISITISAGVVCRVGNSRPYKLIQRLGIQRRLLHWHN